MTKSFMLGAAALGLVTLTGCQGLHRSGNMATAHAESFQVLGLQIPHSAQDKAFSMVPKDAEVVTAVSVPEDTDSVFGVLNRIWGVGYSTVSYKEK